MRWGEWCFHADCPKIGRGVSWGNAEVSISTRPPVSACIRKDSTMRLSAVGLIVTFGIGLLVAPLAAEVQPPTSSCLTRSPVPAHGLPVIGFLSSASPKPYAGRVAGFRKGLNEGGYIDDQNVVIQFCWAQGQYDRLPVFAADLVRQKVAVIVSSGGDVTALAAKAATSSIPIVVVSGSDPVQAGLIASFNQPGGNVTGAS